jgi:flagellar biosynthesis protein FlhB
VSEGDKTEEPTAKRLREAARDGDVLQSRDVSTALVTGVGVFLLATSGAAAVAAMMVMLRSGLQFGAGDVSEFSAVAIALEAGRAVAAPLAVLLAGTMIAAVAAPALLGSLAFRGSAVLPKWSRISPGAGLKRMFGAAGLGELGKSLAKVILIAGVCVSLLYAGRWEIIGLASGDTVSSAAKAGWSINKALAIGALMLAFVALIDVPLQATRRNKRLAMSHDEVTRENREAEGSPELKRERRGRQYALAAMSARSAMKDATVVLTNPTHFAVALRYRPEIDAAPVVVARGMDEAAAAIRDLAKGNDVPMLEYPALTRALYFTSKVGDRVREDLFLAVATVLAFVMNLEAALAAQRSQPDVDVPEDMRFGADGKREA